MRDTENGDSSRQRIEEMKAGADEDETAMVEQENAERDLKFQSLFDLSPIGLIITDVAKGKILEANNPFCDCIPNPTIHIL